MTQPTPGSAGNDDPNKTTVFRPGEFGNFNAAPPFPSGPSATPVDPSAPGEHPHPHPHPSYPPPAASAPAPSPQASYGPPGGYGGQPGGGYGGPPGGGFAGGFGSPPGGYVGQPGGYGGGPNSGYGGGSGRRGPSIAGLIVTALGLAATLVSIFALKWAEENKFSDYHDHIDFLKKYPGIYFEWLAFAALGVATVVAIVAATTGNAAVRAVGGLLGVGGAVATLFAFKASASFSEIFDHAGVGFWVAIGGFVVIGIGALISSRRT